MKLHLGFCGSTDADTLCSGPNPAAPGQPVHISSRYKRRGALQLFAGLSVADWVVYGMSPAETVRGLLGFLVGGDHPRSLGVESTLWP